MSNIVYLKEKNLKTFLKEQGVSEEILNNPSFDNFANDANLSDWLDLIEKHPYVQMSEDSFKNKVIHFGKEERYNQESNFTITISPDGNVSTRLEIERADNEDPRLKASDLYIGIIKKEDDKIVTSEWGKMNNDMPHQLQKEYDNDGIQWVETEVTSPTIQPGFSNFSAHDSYAEDWRVVRREGVGYIASVYCSGKNGNASGYVNIDLRSPERLLSFTRANINMQELKNYPEDYVARELTEELKQITLDNLPAKAREKFKKMMETPLREEYFFEPLKLESNTESRKF